MRLLRKCANSERGIVLLEAVVAIGILGLVVSATLALTSRSTQALHLAADQVIASYLALDASEWIRARKEYNETEGEHWLEGIGRTGSCNASTPCGVTTTASNIIAEDFMQCGSINGCELKKSGDTSYTHSPSDPPTHFSRTISVEKFDLDTVPSDDEQAIYTITVSWRTSGGLTYSTTMYTTLYRTIE